MSMKDYTECCISLQGYGSTRSESPASRRVELLRCEGPAHGKQVSAGVTFGRSERGRSQRVAVMRVRILMGDTVGAAALVDSVSGQPLEAFPRVASRGTPPYPAAQVLSLLGRKAGAVATLQEALNNGQRPAPDEALSWCWAPPPEYPPFQEIVKIRDGDSAPP